MTTTRRGLGGAGAALLLALALPAAAQVADVAAANRAQTTAEGVAILSGGVGDDAEAQMKQAAKDYNVRLVFSNRRGEYLADVPFTVTDARRQTVASGTSDGPLLYLRLPPGRYEVSAQLGGTPVKKRIQATARGRTATDLVGGAD